MFKTLKLIPMKQQIMILVAIICTIVFSVLVAITSYLSNNNAIEQAIEQIKVQAHLSEKVFEVSYEQLRLQADREVNLLSLALPNQFVREDTMMMTGKNPNVPILRNGDVVLNNNNTYIELIRKNTGNEPATMVFHNNEFYRVSTFLKKNNEIMFGTHLPSEDPATLALRQGQPYRGMVFRTGKQYLGVYKPIMNPSNQIIGALSTRIDLQKYIDILTKSLTDVKIGKTGYTFAFTEVPEKERKNKATKSEYLFMLHPHFQGQRDFEVNDPSARGILNPILENVAKHAKTDNIYIYDWIDYNDSKKIKKKVVVCVYIPAWNWYVGIGSFIDEFTEANDKLRNILIILSLISALVTIGLIYTFVSIALKPIQFITQKIGKVGEGDLTVQFFSKPQSRYEMDLLAEKINLTVRRIHDLTKNIVQSANQLEVSSQHIANSAQQITHSSEQQNEATQQVVRSVDHMTTSIENVASNAVEASQISQDAKRCSLEGKEVVQVAINEMNRIASQIEDSSKQIGYLGEKSQKISNIIHVIKEIADQINILALNAAIEAARAGDAGRGFAVVADEVRKLAERTMVSTNEISEVILEVGTETQNAVKIMNTINDSMQSGVKLTHQAGTKLDDINIITERTTLVVDQIVSATREQSSLSQDITNNVNHVEALVDDNNKITQQNRAEAKQLMQLAQDLQRMVNMFKV